MTQRSPRLGHGWRTLPALIGVLTVAGCGTSLIRPTASPSGNNAPVALRNLELSAIDGHRAVLLRLSRVPTVVRQSSSERPVQIIVQAWGPEGDADLPERTLPEADPLISQVRVSRTAGRLSVIFDLQADKVPTFSVHEMADWIMIRFPNLES